MSGKQPLTSVQDVADPTHSALLVVDPQHDFCSPHGALAQHFSLDLTEIGETVPRLNHFIQVCRDAGILVVWIREVFSADKMLLNQKAIWGSGNDGDDIWLIPEGHPGSEWYSEMIEPLPEEPEVKKWQYDGFIDTDLDLLLRSHNIDTLLMTGFTTDMCVGTTARHGYLIGYYIVLVSDCANAPTREEHEAGVTRVKTYFGHVSTSSDLDTLWREGKSVSTTHLPETESPAARK